METSEIIFNEIEKEKGIKADEVRLFEESSEVAKAMVVFRGIVLWTTYYKRMEKISDLYFHGQPVFF